MISYFDLSFLATKTGITVNWCLAIHLPGRRVPGIGRGNVAPTTDDSDRVTTLCH